MKINNGNGVLQRYAVKTFHSRKIFTTLANKEEMDKNEKIFDLHTGYNYLCDYP